MTDFSQKIDLKKDIETTYLGKSLILHKCFSYHGPITMQYIPYGGIQSVFHNNIIIHVKDGYISCKNVTYDGIKMSNKKFIDMFEDLVNTVLPC